MTQGQLLRGVKLVWIQSFLFFRLVAKMQSAVLVDTPSLFSTFTHSFRENRWIHAFPKCLSIKWNTNSLVQKMTQGQLLRGVKLVWIQSFLFFRLVAKMQSAVLVDTPSLFSTFTHSFRENRWIHAFPKCLSIK